MVTKRTKATLGNLVKGERGLILPLALVFMLLGSIMTVSLLSFMSIGLGSSQIYTGKANELYAANAGIKDGIWQVKYDHLSTLFPGYLPYDYNKVGNYTLSEPVNDKNVNVTIQEVWIPRIAPPSTQGEANAIVQNGKLILTGSTSAPSTYKIKITYYQQTGDDFGIKTLGIWLPANFTYVPGSSNLEVSGKQYYSVPVITPHDGGQSVVWNLNSYPFAGDGSHDPFPGVNPDDIPMTGNVTFHFTSQPGKNPEAVSWITTSGIADIPYTWDADNKVYHIASTSGSTSVETYIAKNELRHLPSAIAGDYFATGNSNLSDSDGDKRREIWHDPSSAAVTSNNIPTDADVAAAYLYWTGWKSDNSITSVRTDPADNFTFWPWTAGNRWTISSSRFQGRGISGDTTANRTMTTNSDLNLASYKSSKVFLSASLSKSGTLASGDSLYYALSNDGGSSWSSNNLIFSGNSPPSSFSYEISAFYMTANFRIRFYQTLNSTSKYVFLDNVKIAAMLPDTSIVFKIDDGSGAKQVYLDGNGQPQQGSQELTASQAQVVQNFSGGTTPHGFSYASYCDVTELVRKYSKAPTSPATNWPGYATYWVGGIYADTSPEDEWSYACWSLVIIYSSPKTQGHQLFLYDKFTYSNQDTVNGINVDFDGDSQPGGIISGFIVPEPIPSEVNAGKITCFVGEGDVWYTGDYVALNGVKLWDGTNTTDNSISNPDNVFNSKSLGLGTFDGIDLDTLGIDPPNGQYVTWNSNILKPGDTSAHVDMVTHQDVWNLVYIIISFRSATTTGGNLSFVIRG